MANWKKRKRYRYGVSTEFSPRKNVKAFNRFEHAYPHGRIMSTNLKDFGNCRVFLTIGKCGWKYCLASMGYVQQFARICCNEQGKLVPRDDNKLSPQCILCETEVCSKIQHHLKEGCLMII